METHRTDHPAQDQLEEEAAAEEGDPGVGRPHSIQETSKQTHLLLFERLFLGRKKAQAALALGCGIH